MLALRRPFFHKVLDYEDEFFALLMLVLETHSLRTTGSPVSMPKSLEKFMPILHLFFVEIIFFICQVQFSGYSS